uniref:Uncharacterized protein n=1 Tax=Timema poppense TaxID=170557 RepID=A0A7R9CPM6_TIMPO|nr:unnamed protein product [Timema poppensis]
MDKIFLEYKKPFWVSRDGTVRLGWSRDQLARRSDWSKGITHIEPVAGSKHVLCAWIGGPESAVIGDLLRG